MNNFSRYLGGILITSGTTIGAGMLALPVISASIGFLWSTVLLVLLWLLMTYTALVTLEVNIHFKKSMSIVTMAEKVLGRYFKFIAFSSIIMLFYSLISAYITGAVEILHNSVFNVLQIDYIPKRVSSILLVLCIGFIVFCSTQIVDYSNRIFFAIKMLFFAAMLAMFFPYVKLEYLFTTELVPNTFSFAILGVTIPIFFTSFGFHGSIPTIINYIGYDDKNIKKVFIIGSLLPLLIYILWEVIALGVLPLTGNYSYNTVAENNNDIGIFISSLSSTIAQPLLPYITSVFSWLAIITSLIGVAVGLFDFLIEILKYNIFNHKDRFKAALLTFCLPLLISILYPKIFITALAFAAIALSILAIIIPTLSAIKLRKEGGCRNYRVSGGNLALIIALTLGIGIIIIEIIPK